MGYESKLLSLTVEELPIPKSFIPYANLSALLSIEKIDIYENELRKLAKRLPYETTSWPSFGEYVENHIRVNINAFQYHLLHCERGSCQVIEDCKNIIDLSYQILKIVSPSKTPSALKIAESLDRILDQRLLIWLSMSSEIFYMYNVNKYFGTRALYTNVTWMCEELVRMGVFEDAFTAFCSKKHIVHGLTLSGLPKSTASKFYEELLFG